MVRSARSPPWRSAPPALHLPALGTTPCRIRGGSFDVYVTGRGRGAAEARAEFERAAALARNARERYVLRARAAALTAALSGG